MRYVQNTPSQINQMLDAIGVGSVEELFNCIPEELKLKQPLNLPPALTEQEVYKHMLELSQKNITSEDYLSLLGAGCYDHYIPAVVDAIASRSEFYTSYTPYQAEASQGNLQVMFEFQTMICELTGLDIANASHYDGATALAEAVIMTLRTTENRKIAVSKALHPEYRQVLNTYLEDVTIIDIPYNKNGLTDFEQIKRENFACVVVQNPNFLGCLEDMDACARVARDSNAVPVAVVEPLSLVITKPPGELGFDIAVGDAQPFGLDTCYGGPLLGFISAKEKYLRSMPGRISGQTTDKHEKRGFTLTLQTREQHIRRERATSNICTNQALMALRAVVFMASYGKKGLQELAVLCASNAHYLAEKLSRIPSVKLLFSAPFFQEFAVGLPLPASQVNQRLLEHKIIGGLDLARYFPELGNSMLIYTSDKLSQKDMDYIADVFQQVVK